MAAQLHRVRFALTSTEDVPRAEPDVWSDAEAAPWSRAVAAALEACRGGKVPQLPLLLDLEPNRLGAESPPAVRAAFLLELTRAAAFGNTATAAWILQRFAVTELELRATRALAVALERRRAEAAWRIARWARALNPGEGFAFVRDTVSSMPYGALRSALHDADVRDVLRCCRVNLASYAEGNSEHAALLPLLVMPDTQLTARRGTTETPEDLAEEFAHEPAPLVRAWVQLRYGTHPPAPLQARFPSTAANATARAEFAARAQAVPEVAAWLQQTPVDYPTVVGPSLLQVFK